MNVTKSHVQNNGYHNLVTGSVPEAMTTTQYGHRLREHLEEAHETARQHIQQAF
ncbi:hypothetical protein GE061_008119, partial [Apolygus lucorum]